ncbi:MAG: HAD-IC family P-type ATPase [Clostridia bacterium]|nr:HAD-IC family P-type ATPase [Clostridia bacterium]
MKKTTTKKQANNPTEEPKDTKPAVVLQPNPVPKKKVKKILQRDAKRHDVSLDFGLSNEQVEDRVATGLTNNVKARNSKSIPAIIFGNTFTFFNLLCAIVIVAYSIVRAEIGNFTFIIPFALNLIIGIFQEIRAKLSIEKLSILQAPITTVIRNGQEYEISTKDLVLDDVFKIVSGNQIPVDGVVLDGYAEVNESLLTGESVAIKKRAGDVLLAGSFVTSGALTAKADKVAEECYVQKLTEKAKKHKKPNSELMGTLTWIVKIVGLIIVPIAVGIGLVNYKNPILGETFKNIQHFVVTRTGAVVLGMIPAGLILLTTIALSLGVIRLYKRNTLVQDMFSLEMLARVDVLCLDKTGTITDGRMEVIKDIIISERHPYSLSDIIGTMQSVFSDNNATSAALRAHYQSNANFTVVKTIPFSSARKYSAVTFSEMGTYAIGAPEFVLKELTPFIREQMDHYINHGNRVLLLAHSSAQITAKGELPSSLKPIALIVLSDNIRPEAIETIKWFKDNSVGIKVISGDNPITVSEIAKRAGIENASNWISLEGLSDKEVASIADKYTVFGRVTPDQKCVLVKALKMGGHTVAMTGDGVNDILAMREADCSITVATGADAAKSVAHIVLADNNFNSMPKVVAEGRRVINNIQQSASLFLMKTIFTALLAFISIATMNPFPFETKHLTMLELFVIGFASLALSLQPNEKRVEGDFLTTIFSNAIPGALILLMNLYIIKLISLFGIFPSEEFTMTMQVVAFTLGGVVYLHKVCKPYNALRVIIIGIVIAVMTVWVIFLLDTSATLHIDNFFGLTSLFPLTMDNWEYPLILLAIIELNLLLNEPLSNLNKLLFSSFRKAKKDE